MTTPQKLRFAVTGGTGLIGRGLCAMLTAQGHQVWTLQRATSGPAPATWNVPTGAITTPQPVDVVVHLAGQNVATRWSARVRQQIWDSRVPATEKLCAFLAQLPPAQRPRVLIAASAIGIYGHRGDELLTEASPVADPNKSFLADVCRSWEKATQIAADAGIRVVTLRLGLVLSRDGGLLARLAGPVQWGLGGPVGSGTQYQSWISRTDVCRLILQVAEDDTVGGVGGIINAVGPVPVRQHEFIRTLGNLLHRPVIFPLPSFMVKLLFGQMGIQMLLASQRVVATRLPAGFTYLHGTLEEALRAELGL